MSVIIAIEPSSSDAQRKLAPELVSTASFSSSGGSEKTPGEGADPSSVTTALSSGSCAQDGLAIKSGGAVLPFVGTSPYSKGDRGMDLACKVCIGALEQCRDCDTGGVRP